MFKTDVVIVGAGMAGLSAAHFLQKSGRDLVVLEKSSRAGGALRTEKREGFLLELGPNTVLPKPDLWEMIEDLGLKNEAVLADPTSPRFILYRRYLHPVPLSPVQLLLTTRLISISGRLRMLKEPFVPQRIQEADEDVLSFFRRRLGPEISERLVAPFVSGIWAGDAEKLSARSAFPNQVEWEKEYGSLLKGLFHRRPPADKQKTKKIRGLLTFKNGLETLPQALSQSIGNRLHLNCDIQSLENNAGRWRVYTSLGDFESTRLIMTIPAHESARLLRGLSETSAKALESIPYAPLAVFHFGFMRNQIKHPLEGFGYLVAPSEITHILGCLWNSSLFPDRAPQGTVLLTAFMGGMGKEDLLSRQDEDITNLALEDISTVLKISGKPVFSSLTRYSKAIPQYTIGHQSRWNDINEVEKNFSGLRLAGNFRDGISVGDVVKNAKRTALELF